MVFNTKLVSVSGGGASVKPAMSPGQCTLKSQPSHNKALVQLPYLSVFCFPTKHSPCVLSASLLDTAYSLRMPFDLKEGSPYGVCIVILLTSYPLPCCVAP